jgi:hypothetical protein
LVKTSQGVQVALPKNTLVNATGSPQGVKTVPAGTQILQAQPGKSIPAGATIVKVLPGGTVSQGW